MCLQFCGEANVRSAVGLQVLALNELLCPELFNQGINLRSFSKDATFRENQNL
jgi:hypothetical protein